MWAIDGSAGNAPFFRNGVFGKPCAKALDVKLQFKTQLANLLYLDAVVRSSEKFFAQPPNMVFYSTSHGPCIKRHSGAGLGYFLISVGGIGYTL